MNLRAEAFKIFCKQLSAGSFAPLLPMLMAPLERLAGPKDFELAVLLEAEHSDAWFWQYQAARFLGAQVHKSIDDPALDALCRLATSPRPLVVEGAARGLAEASLRLGPQGHELLSRLTEPDSPPLVRCAAAHALGEVLKARWPRDADAIRSLLRRAAMDLDGRVRRGVGQYLIGNLLFAVDPGAAQELAAAWLGETEPNLKMAAKEAQSAMRMK